jgi:hypothetical protein
VKTKLPHAVSVHLHDDKKVTSARVRAFGDASYETHLRVVTELRLRASDDTSHVELSAVSLMFALYALIFAPKMVELTNTPWWAALVVGGVLGIILLVVVLPFAVPQILHHNKRQRAQLWLATYQDEISRRHGQSTRAARRWQASH